MALSILLLVILILDVIPFIYVTLDHVRLPAFFQFIMRVALILALVLCVALVAGKPYKKEKKEEKAMTGLLKRLLNALEERARKLTRSWVILYDK